MASILIVDGLSTEVVARLREAVRRIVDELNLAEDYVEGHINTLILSQRSSGKVTFEELSPFVYSCERQEAPVAHWAARCRDAATGYLGPRRAIRGGSRPGPAPLKPEQAASSYG